MWSGIPISLRRFHRFCDAVKGFSIVNEAEVDFFLEFPCFSSDLPSICLCYFSALSTLSTA